MSQCGVSVIICCHNSAERLPKTLEYLANQQVRKGIQWEIIVVDNLSTDNTAQIAQQEWEIRSGLVPMKVVRQEIPGLSYARQKGIEASLYDLLIFCDDDNWLFPTYVQHSFELAEKNRHVAAIGGQGIAISNVELPKWFDCYKMYYACFPQAESTGELKGKMARLYGAGLVLRKESFQTLITKGFSALISDRIGTKLTSGGDNELCYALQLTGHKLYYSEDLKFYHFIPENRLTRNYLLRLINGISYSSMALILYHYAMTEKKITRFTWTKDFAYRLFVFAFTSIMTLTKRDPLEKKLSIQSSYSALTAIMQLHGKYESVYEQLLALKR